MQVSRGRAAPVQQPSAFPGPLRTRHACLGARQLYCVRRALEVYPVARRVVQQQPVGAIVVPYLHIRFVGCSQ